jgi:hypothetical protein
MKIKQWLKQIFNPSVDKNQDWISILDNTPKDGELVSVKGSEIYNNSYYRFETIGFVKKFIWYYYAGPSEFRADETRTPYFWKKIKA